MKEASDFEKNQIYQNFDPKKLPKNNEQTKITSSNSTENFFQSLPNVECLKKNLNLLQEKRKLEDIFGFYSIKDNSYEPINFNKEGYPTNSNIEIRREDSFCEKSIYYKNKNHSNDVYKIDFYKKDGKDISQDNIVCVDDNINFNNFLDSFFDFYISINYKMESDYIELSIIDKYNNINSKFLKDNKFFFNGIYVNIYLTFINLIILFFFEITLIKINNNQKLIYFKTKINFQVQEKNIYANYFTNSFLKFIDKIIKKRCDFNQIAKHILLTVKKFIFFNEKRKKYKFLIFKNNNIIKKNSFKKKNIIKNVSNKLDSEIKKFNIYEENPIDEYIYELQMKQIPDIEFLDDYNKYLDDIII